MWFETADLIVALGPLAFYLLALAAVNLLNRPFLISGARDLAALAVGVSGLVMVGPVQLFTPADLLLHLGPYYWLLMLLLYGSSVTLAILFLRPRLVLYNMGGDHLRGLLSLIAQRLDPHARWAGNTLELPQAGLLLRLESFPAFRNATLSTDGEVINFASWRWLCAELAAALSEVRVSRNPRGFSLATAGLLILIALSVYWFRDPQGTAQGFYRLLGL